MAKAFDNDITDLNEELGLGEPEQTDDAPNGGGTGDEETLDLDQTHEPQDEVPAEEGTQQDETAEQGAEPAKDGKSGQRQPKTVTVEEWRYKKLQEKNRKLQRRLAEREALEELTGPQAASQPPQQPEQEPDPLDQWEQEHAEEIKADPDYPVPGRVLRAKQNHDARKAQERQQQAAAQSSQQVAKVSLARAKVKYASDDALNFMGVVNEGKALLTPTDWSIIRSAGEETGEQLYSRCLKRIRQSGSEAADEIDEAITARRQSNGASPDKPNPPLRTPNSNRPNNGQRQRVQQTQRNEEPPSREQILGRTGPMRAHQRLGIRFPDAMPAPSEG